MTFQSIWYYTDLPNKIIEIIEEDLKDNFDPHLQDSRVGEGDYGTVDKIKETQEMPGFHQHIGLLVLFGIMFKGQTAKIFYTT